MSRKHHMSSHILTLLYKPFINSEIQWNSFVQLESYNTYLHIIFKPLDLDQMRMG